MSIELQVFPSLFDIFFILTRDEWDLIIETVTSSELELESEGIKMCSRNRYGLQSLFKASENS